MPAAESSEGRTNPSPDSMLAAKTLGLGFAWAIVELAPDGILVGDATATSSWSTAKSKNCSATAARRSSARR